MTVQEFYLLVDTRRPRDPRVDYAGGLDERTCSTLYDLLE